MPKNVSFTNKILIKYCVLKNNTFCKMLIFRRHLLKFWQLRFFSFGIENYGRMWIFFHLFIYFSWRIIALQCCEGFCHTSTWIGSRYICISLILNPHPPPSPPHPSGLSWSTCFGCPASCIELALVICFTYGNVHVSMLFSQIIPLLASSTESKSLFFISVSPLMPCI